jgi:hypothetical protein
MPRIKLEDLPSDTNVSFAQIYQISGGTYPLTYFEQQLQSIGDDSQLANLDLQNHMQKLQQTLQMLSNVSKVSHDTAMAIIRKIG